MLLAHPSSDKGTEHPPLLAAAADALEAKQQLDASSERLGGDVSSVIIQVTSRDETSCRPLVSCELETPEPLSRSWRSKVRSLLCCFAPSGQGYFKDGADHGAVGHHLRPPPPVPPRWFKETVIGAHHPEDVQKKTLVLDLDETLVHSSFKPIPNPDYIIPVDIDGRMVDVYVLKRPWMDHFMATIAPKFEVVVFTASLAKYADPLLDLLDPSGLVRWRLFRESCCPYEGNYVKDLNCLGRDLAQTIIVDNSPHSYVFQPANALPIGTFIDDMEDQELLDIMPALLKVEHAPDVRTVLDGILLSQMVANGSSQGSVQSGCPPGNAI